MLTEVASECAILVVPHIQEEAPRHVVSLSTLLASHRNSDGLKFKFFALVDGFPSNFAFGIDAMNMLTVAKEHHATPVLFAA
jgi:hypothetical protein